MVESQPSKLLVAGPIPVSRSNSTVPQRIAFLPQYFFTIFFDAMTL